jgi:uncharacterized protein YbbC (DUF1343 family)
MSDVSFQPGIVTLLRRQSRLLAGRVGLLSHPAAVDARGASSAALLRERLGPRLTALFGPEHGFFGGAGAGVAVRTRHHSIWGIPAYSLYGEFRKPSRDMLRRVDTIVIDLQNLATRCYTYLSTLKLVMEAAAAAGKRVIVADRPTPLPCTVDGPVLDARFESFVAALRVPLAYGMTPGEAALWIRADQKLDLDLSVAPMLGYFRGPRRGAGWPSWIPPSPGIASWESAECYPATVFAEAFPALDRGRDAGLPFQVLGMPGIRGRDLAAALEGLAPPGIAFHPHSYSRVGDASVRHVEGVRLTVVEPDRYRPALTSLCLVSALQEAAGKRLWRTAGARPEWFDKLYGVAWVREALLDGEMPARIAARWERDCAAFAATRRAVLLYPRS